METVEHIAVFDERVRRWAELANQSSSIRQLCIEPKGEEAGVAMLEGENGQVVAREMDWVDGAFFLEARRAVINLADLVATMRDYLAYVEYYAAHGAVPFIFEDWLKIQKEGQE